MAISAKDQKSLNRQKSLLWKFQGVDVYRCRMTLNKARAFTARSKAGERQEVRDDLLKLKGAVDVSDGQLPDLTIPTPRQGISLRFSCDVDIRECQGLTRIQAGGFVKQMKEGANGTVRSSLLAMGAKDMAN